MEIRAQFNLKVPVKITQKKKWYVASCPILDVHSQGETEKKAKENLAEALSLFLISCFERGTLDQVLKNCGFKPANRQISQKRYSPSKTENYITVPIPFLVNREFQQACHA
jgi:predicted RNase H-like HicB family nuclease